MSNQPLPSGSTNVESQGLPTSRDTASSTPSNDEHRLLDSLAVAAMLSPERARSWKPVPTAPKKKAASRARGASARRPLTFEADTQVSSPFALDSEEERPLRSAQGTTPQHSFGTAAGFETLPICSVFDDGVTWSDSTFGVPLAPVNPRSSTTHSGTFATGRCRVFAHSLPHRYDNVYALAGKSPLWFDSYQGEAVLLIDEYQGGLDAEAFLRLVDGHPYQGPCKHGFVAARWSVVVVVSNYELFTCMPPELKRRFAGGCHQLLGQRGDYVELGRSLLAARAPP